MSPLLWGVVIGAAVFTFAYVVFRLVLLIEKPE